MKNVYTRLASSGNASKNIANLNLYNLNGRNHPTFSEGTPFVGSVLSRKKSHSIVYLTNQT